MNGASFGCGQCQNCRYNRRRLWMHRIMLEAAVHPASSFLTLTYNDDHLPENGSLRPVDLQLYLKRLRKHVAPLTIRYFGVGEYGDISWRPHYHAAIFGLGPENGQIMDKCWGQGFTYAGTLTLHSAQYIAGYVTKKMTQVDDARLQGRYPEFARMSLRPGIGAPAISDIASALDSSHGWDYIHNRGDVPEVLKNNGKDLPLGRYMRERLRGVLGFTFKELNNREEVREKTIKMYTMYKDYASSKAEPLGFASWIQSLEDNANLKRDVRSKIHGGKKL